MPTYGKYPVQQRYTNVGRHRPQQLSGARPPATSNSYANLILAETDLVAYWPLNEPEGVVYDNKSRYDLTAGGTINRSATGLLTTTSDTAFDLANDSGVLTSNDPIPRGSTADPFSFEIWLQPDAITDGEHVAQWIGSFQLQIKSNGLRFTDGLAANIDDTSGALSTSAPTHIVATFDGTNGRLYRNGALVAGPTAMAPGATSSRFFIGGLDFGGPIPQFNGTMDEIALYNDDLSLSEIQAHYGAGIVTYEDGAGAAAAVSSAVAAPQKVLVGSAAMNAVSTATAAPTVVKIGVPLGAAAVSTITGGGVKLLMGSAVMTAVSTATARAASNVLARSFDGINDRITFPVSGLTLTGAVTQAFIFRRGRSGVIEDFWNSPANSLGFVDWSNRIIMTEGVSGNWTTSNMAFTPSDGWVMFIMTRPSGSGTPRGHKYVFNTDTWSHTDFFETPFVPYTAPSGADYVLGGIGSYFQGEIALHAFWDQELSDAQVEELADTLATQDWKDNSAGIPDSMWELSQASTGTTVEDLISTRDQSALTGTAITWDGPPNWTYGLDISYVDGAGASAAVSTATAVPTLVRTNTAAANAVSTITGGGVKVLVGTFAANAVSSATAVPIRALVNSAIASAVSSAAAIATVSDYYEEIYDESGLVSYWPLDETTGTVYDHFGTDHMTAVGTINRSATSLIGTAEPSFDLTDESGVLHTSGDALSHASATDPFSFEIWVQPDNIHDDEHIAQWVSIFQISVKTNGIRAAFNATNVDDTSGALPTNAPTQIVITYDGTNGRLYRNGNLVAGPTAASYGGSQSADIYVGGLWFLGPIPQFDGKLDQVSLYDEALTPTQIESHYEIGGGQVIVEGAASASAVSTAAAEPVKVLVGSFAANAVSTATCSGGVLVKDASAQMNAVSTAIAAPVKLLIGTFAANAVSTATAIAGIRTLGAGQANAVSTATCSGGVLVKDSAGAASAVSTITGGGTKVLVGAFAANAISTATASSNIVRIGVPLGANAVSTATAVGQVEDQGMAVAAAVSTATAAPTIVRIGVPLGANAVSTATAAPVKLLIGTFAANAVSTASAVAGIRTFGAGAASAVSTAAAVGDKVIDLAASASAVSNATAQVGVVFANASAATAISSASAEPTKVLISSAAMSAVSTASASPTIVKIGVPLGASAVSTASADATKVVEVTAAAVAVSTAIAFGSVQIASASASPAISSAAAEGVKVLIGGSSAAAMSTATADPFGDVIGSGGADAQSSASAEGVRVVQLTAAADTVSTASASPELDTYIDASGSASAVSTAAATYDIVKDSASTASAVSSATASSVLVVLGGGAAAAISSATAQGQKVLRGTAASTAVSTATASSTKMLIGAAIANAISTAVGVGTVVPIGTQAVIDIVFGPDEDTISKVAGKRVVNFSWEADVEVHEYKVKVVPDEDSLHTEGTLIPTTNGSTNMQDVDDFPAGTDIDSSIDGRDLETASAGDGDKIIKVFARNNFTWSE